MSAKGNSGDDRTAGCSRRLLLMAAGSAAIGSSLLGCRSTGKSTAAGYRKSAGREEGYAAGPGARYVPTLKVAFVRRKGEYGMRWPGAVYDGEQARERYTREIEEAADRLGMKLDLRPVPLHSLAEAEAWTAQAADQRPDGLLVVVLDRQEHAWPTVARAVESGIPTIAFSPLGTSFTTNTHPLARRTGLLLSCTTGSFEQAAYGMKMLAASARLREMRYVVLKGDERRDTQIGHFGTKLRYVPARTFLDEYRQTETSPDVKRIARDYVRGATGMTGTTFEDVCNGVKSYLVARRILEREEADGITMDCLGALGHTEVSLPCIAWSRMLDHGIPAACEADLSACVTHALVQLLFDRPGFQQDPVPETTHGYLVGAHCSCPTRLNGFDQPPEPYRLSYHHGKRDAVPVTRWKPGQRVTVVDVLFPGKGEARPKLLISAGSVVENLSVPPAGGCVVSVMIKLDGVEDTLAYPGFHQQFLYGDFKRELQDYCQLCGIEPLVV